jgi:shikimate dehydrogenase
LKTLSGILNSPPAAVSLSAKIFRPEMWVSEIVYMPLETPLLKAARRIGCPTADGGHMNVGQAIRGFKLFTGLDADAARMDAHFRQIVGRVNGE